jgi:uncharacterized protein (DUF1697 family)
MTRNVALLRAINLGAASTRVPMAVLRDVFSAAGCTDVTTLLNSGNVVFTGTPDPAQLTKWIAAESGVTTSVLVLEADRFRRITEAMPFEGDESKLTIAFMGEVPTGVVVPDGLEPEQIHLGADAVYQSLPDGVSATKLKPAFWKQFPPETTARNLRTVKKIVAAL